MFSKYSFHQKCKHPLHFKPWKAILEETNATLSRQSRTLKKLECAIMCMWQSWTVILAMKNEALQASLYSHLGSVGKYICMNGCLGYSNQMMYIRL